MTDPSQLSPESRSRRYRLAAGLSQAGAVLVTSAFVVVLSAAILSLSGVRTAFVVSGSMEPTFSKGDLLLVVEDYDEVVVGDIVLYDAEWSEHLVSHRVVDVSGEWLVLRGDANEYSDPAALRSSVFGVVEKSLPGVGWVVNPYGIWGLLGLGFALDLASVRFEYVGRHRA